MIFQTGTYFGMGDTDLARSCGSQFPKFVNEVPTDDLVEIPLFSDGENDASESYNNMVSRGPRHSLVEIEPVFPPQSSSKSTIEAFFQSAYTPSPKLCNSHIDGSNCQNFDDDDDDDDDLKFNKELANAIRYQCSLFSPSLVRATNSDIKEIKRSLTVSDTSTGESLYFPPKQEPALRSTSHQTKEVQNSELCINDQDNFDTGLVYKYHRSDKHSKGYRRPELSRYQTDR